MSWYEPQPKQEPKQLPRRRPEALVPSEVGAKGLVGNWLFYAKGGNHLHDFSRKNNHATIYGAKWVDKGLAGWALDFDGTDNYAQAGRALSSGNATVSVWAKWEGTLDPGNAQYVIWGQFDLGSEIDSGQTTKNLFYLQVNGWSDEFKANYETDAGDAYSVSSISLDNNWHHFAVVLREGEPILMYVDGVKYSGATLPSSLVYDNMPSGFSIYGNRNAYFNGKICNCHVYNRALSGTEVKEIYDAEKAMFK